VPLFFNQLLYCRQLSKLITKINILFQIANNLLKSHFLTLPLTTEAKTRAGLRGTFLSPVQENSSGVLSIENLLKPAWDVAFVMRSPFFQAG
jgi:hypothetical protein